MKVSVYEEELRTFLRMSQPDGKDAFVHPKSILKKLKKISSHWNGKPTKVYPAKRVDSVTIITGPAFPFV